jgi:hypothetical protein
MTSMSASPDTVAGAMQAVRRMLSQNLNDEIAVVGQDYAPGAETIALRVTPRRFGPGTVLSWHDATLYVVDSSPSGVTVIDGYDGAPGCIVPAGTPMRVSPRFSDYTLFQTICEQVDLLSSPANGLYGVVSERFPGMRTDDYYPIPVTAQGPSSDSVLKVLSVRTSDNVRDWTNCGNYTVALNSQNPHLRIFADTSDVEVTYAVKIAPPTSYTDSLVTDCGLPRSAIDVPALGAAATLMWGQEARRVNQRAQGDPRRAEDTPITGATNAARELARRYRDRLDEEHARLVQRNPYRLGVMQ